jgi:hypothetical protein
MPNEFVIKNGYISKGNSIVEGGLTVTTISATTYSNLPSSPITIGTSQLTSGTDTRVLFQSGTTLQQDGNFTYNTTQKRLILKAVGTSSTDIPFAVRNSTDSATIFTVRGDQAIEMIRENPSTNGGILITKTDNYNSPRIQLYNVFNQLTDINGTTITTSNLKSGSSGAAGYMGIVNTTSQDRFLKFINLFGNETLSIGGNNYDGAATFTLKSWAGTSPGVIFNIVKSDNTNPFVITDAARVGIGTNSPQSRLDVRAQGALSTDIAFRVRNSADNLNTLQSTGDGKTRMQGSVNYTEFDPAIGLYVGNNFGNMINLSGVLQGTSWFNQGQDGKLAIGKTSANYRLDVNTSTTNNNEAIRVNNANSAVDGKVGISFTNTWTGDAFGSVGGTLYMNHQYVGPNNAIQHCRFDFALNSLNTSPSVKVSVTAKSNILVGTPTENIADSHTIYIQNGTIPTSGITDGYKQYSSDITAGNAAPHFRTENGSIVKLYQNDNTVAIDDVLVNVGLRASGGTSNFSNSISATTISATTFYLSGSQLETLWTSYSPNWTASSSNPSIGDGTIEGYYKLIGKTCFVRGNIAMGSTTTFGSGEWYVELPFPAKHADGILMTANLLDNGTAWYNAVLNGARSGFNNKAPIQYQGGAGTALDVNATQPFTWANSDRFIWNGSYEIL